jgi:2-polyprenyl-6-methoxyphenol hydroxylase-like FAD-dependent oxidoreductase
VKVPVQARTLELLEQRGLVERMLAKGNRGLAAASTAKASASFGSISPTTAVTTATCSSSSQAETEATLRAALENQQVTLEREVEFVALSQSEHADSVKPILKHRDGTLEEVSCEYLIDSEGAHSISRMTLNLQFEGKTREENHALGDLYVDGDLPTTDFHIFSSQVGFMGLFPRRRTTPCNRRCPHGMACCRLTALDHPSTRNSSSRASSGPNLR